MAHYVLYIAHQEMAPTVNTLAGAGTPRWRRQIGNGPVGNLRGFAARLVPRRKVIVNNPNRSGYDFPWWAALILLMIFGITMFLSGYLVGRMY